MTEVKFELFAKKKNIDSNIRKRIESMTDQKR